MTIDAFIICTEDGKPIEFDELPEDANSLEYGVITIPLFKTAEAATDVLDSLPGSAYFEGFKNGTVHHVTVTIHGVVATQTNYDEEDED